MKIAAVSIASVPLVLIVIVGVAFLTSPAPDERIEWVKIADLSSVPADGRPRAFVVLEPHHDAWSRLPDRPVDRIFLRRDAHRNEVTALEGRHGRFGVPIEFDEHAACFKSTCYIVQFDIEGCVLDDSRIERGTFEAIRRPEVQVRDDQIFIRRASISPAVL